MINIQRNGAYVHKRRVSQLVRKCRTRIPFEMIKGMNVIKKTDLHYVKTSQLMRGILRYKFQRCTASGHLLLLSKSFQVRP